MNPQENYSKSLTRGKKNPIRTKDNGKETVAIKEKVKLSYSKWIPQHWFMVQIPQIHKNWRHQALLIVGCTKKNAETWRISPNIVSVVRPLRAPSHPTQKDYTSPFLQKTRDLEKWNQSESGVRNIRCSCGPGYWTENKALTENINTCDIIKNIFGLCSSFLA